MRSRLRFAAFAQPSPSPPVSSRSVELRLALSSSAAQHLSEARIRRLIEIELDDGVLLAPGTSGPLGDHVAYVWIDEPSTSRVTIEVRLGDRPVARRELNLAGLQSDVAARFAVVALVEMLHAQMQPAPKPRRTTPLPRRPTPDEAEAASRAAPTVFAVVAAEATALPEASGLLVGPSIGAGFRFQQVSEALLARIEAGKTDPGATRLVEGALLVEGRAWVGSSFRFTLGAEASAGTVHLGDALAVDRLAGEKDTWLARASAAVGGEARLSRGLWIGVALVPGALLRPIPYATAGDRSGFLRGLALGTKITLTFERPSAPAPLP